MIDYGGRCNFAKGDSESHAGFATEGRLDLEEGGCTSSTRGAEADSRSPLGRRLRIRTGLFGRRITYRPVSTFPAACKVSSEQQRQAQ
eukprot:6157391-Pyramimonas_sp.AAC.1